MTSSLCIPIPVRDPIGYHGIMDGDYNYRISCRPFKSYKLNRISLVRISHPGIHEWLISPKHIINLRKVV